MAQKPNRYYIKRLVKGTQTRKEEVTMEEYHMTRNSLARARVKHNLTRTIITRGLVIESAAHTLIYRVAV